MTEPQTRIHDTELEKALVLHKRRLDIVQALRTLDASKLGSVRCVTSGYDSDDVYSATGVTVSRYGEAVMTAVRVEVCRELEYVEHELRALGVSLSTAANLL